jgi:ribokinase
MLVVFGSLMMDIRMQVDALPIPNEKLIAQNHETSVGGQGLNQAIAAIRAGAKVAIIGCVGDDDFGASIQNRLRQEGISAAGISKSDSSTGLQTTIQSAEGFYSTSDLSANNTMTPDQIPSEYLGKHSLLLLQTQIDMQHNEAVLELAKSKGAATIMNLSPSINLTRKALDNLDYLIVNHAEAMRLAEKLGLKTENDALKIAHGLATEGSLCCVVTLGEKGAVAVDYTTPNDRSAWSINAMELDDVVDHSGAEDAYCGTFAACIYAGMPLHRAMKRAGIAGSLACKTHGIKSAFAHLDDIENEMDNCPEAQKEELNF